MSKPELWIHCDDRLFEILTNRHQSAPIEFVKIQDSIPLGLLTTPGPVIWQSTEDIEQDILEFLYHLKDTGRDIIVGNAETLAREVAHLIAKYSSTDTQAVLESFETRQTAVLVAAETRDDLDDLVSLAGYNLLQCSIPPDRQAVEQADLVILHTPPGQNHRFDKIADILKNRMNKDVILLNFDNPREQLIEILTQRASLPGWATGNAHDLLDDPDMTRKTSALLEILEKIRGFEIDLADIRDRLEPNFPLYKEVESLTRWLRKWMAYDSPDDLPSWKLARDPKTEQLDTVKELRAIGIALSMLMGTLRESRRELVETSAAMIRSSGILARWEGVEGEALDLLTRLHLRQCLSEPAESHREALKTLEPPESPKSAWFISKEGKEAQKSAMATWEEMTQKARSSLKLIERERALITDCLITGYWTLYEAACRAWIEPTNRSDDLRQFLRTGFVGPEFLKYSQEQLNQLHAIRQEREPAWHFLSDERHVVWMDEHIEHLANEETGLCFNEDLELNERGTPRWKQARRTRQLATLKRHRNLHAAMILELEGHISLLDQDLEQIEHETAAAGGPDQASPLLQERKRECQLARTRLLSHQEACRQLEQETPMTCLSLDDVDESEVIPLSEWIMDEIATFRRTSKLIAGKKEAFIPDVLQNGLRPGSSTVTRRHLTETLRTIEERDCTLFEKTLIAHDKREHACIARQSPEIIILPGSGRQGVCLEGADELQEGRLVVPLNMTHPKGLDPLLMDILADWRWETDMADAGSEWVTTDSLVGHYSRARWDYRRLEKEAREKAQVFKELNDRVNFRKHYALYVGSALEQGRQLHYKSRSIYAALNRFLPLPPGVQPLET